MCHTAALESAQIERCVNGGMPERIGKSLQYSLKKRQAREERRMEPKIELENVQPEMQEKQRVETLKIGNSHINGEQMKDKDNQNQVQEESIDKSELVPKRCPVTNALAVAASLYPPSTASAMKKQQNNLLPGSLFMQNRSVSGINGQGEAFDTLYGTDMRRRRDADISNENLNNNNNNLYKTEVKIKSISENNSPDLLGRGMNWFMLLIGYLQHRAHPLKNSKFFILLTKTTQPAHIVALGLSFFVLFSVWPDLQSNLQQQQHKQQSDLVRREDRKKLWAFCIYLAAFATHFGAQIWMTFVSGLSLFFSLPRHLFGRCQQILFPKYFTLNAALSILMLIFYTKYLNGSWKLTEFIQFVTIMITGIVEVIIRLYLTPPLLHNMLEKYRIEDIAGMGSEVATNLPAAGIVLTDLIKCPHYQLVHKRFRRLHMIVATGNIFTMITSCVHLYYLAELIQIAA